MEPFFPKESLLVFSKHKPAENCSHVMVRDYKSHNILFRQIIIDDDYKYIKPLNPDTEHLPMYILQHDANVLGVMTECVSVYGAMKRD
jgi:Peptidase S24-like